VKVLQVEQDSVAQALLSLVPPGGYWSGSTEELRRDLEYRVSSLRNGDFPRSARALTNRLKRLVLILQSVGFEIEWIPVGHNQREISITRRADEFLSVEEVDERSRR
jgi:hypothetical protein